MTSLLLLSVLAANLSPLVPGEPLLEPQLAVRGQNVALVFGEGHAIYFSASRDSGFTFSPPVRVTPKATAAETVFSPR